MLTIVSACGSINCISELSAAFRILDVSERLLFNVSKVILPDPFFYAFIHLLLRLLLLNLMTKERSLLAGQLLSLTLQSLIFAICVFQRFVLTALYSPRISIKYLLLGQINIHYSGKYTLSKIHHVAWMSAVFSLFCSFIYISLSGQTIVYIDHYSMIFPLGWFWLMCCKTPTQKHCL